jgi:hypothetical protein
VRAQALRLIDAGDSLNRISRATGINRATLREWRERRGTVAPRHECRCPPCSSTPLPRDPYLYLLGQYLGDGCISKLRRSWVLRIATCD